MNGDNMVTIQASARLCKDKPRLDVQCKEGQGGDGAHGGTNNGRYIGPKTGGSKEEGEDKRARFGLA